MKRIIALSFILIIGMATIVSATMGGASSTIDLSSRAEEMATITAQGTGTALLSNPNNVKQIKVEVFLFKGDIFVSSGSNSSSKTLSVTASTSAKEAANGAKYRAYSVTEITFSDGTRASATSTEKIITVNCPRCPIQPYFEQTSIQDKINLAHPFTNGLNHSFGDTLAEFQVLKGQEEQHFLENNPALLNVYLAEMHQLKIGDYRPVIYINDHKDQIYFYRKLADGTNILYYFRLDHDGEWEIFLI